MATDKKTSGDRLKAVPEALRKRLNDKQKRVVDRYESLDKLKAVLRWKGRLTKAGLTSRELSLRLNKPEPRISEYINLKKEPEENTYLAIESAIYDMGA